MAVNRPPRFSEDPYGWFTWIAAELRSRRWRALQIEVEPTRWVGGHGNEWRVMRSTTGLEVRPALIRPFIHHTDSPRVTAIALGDEIEVEITTRDMRWVDRFPLGSLDVGALGRTMLDEAELPHDNLPSLFPPRT